MTPADRPRLPVRRTSLLLAVGLVAVAAPRVDAQDGPAPERAGEREFPFRPPTASPLEPATRIGPVHAWREDGSGWVVLADIGDRIPFWLRRDADGGPALAGAVAGAAFSRFDLERPDNEFIEVHYRVGLQLLLRRGSLAARAELYHASSHLGDEFLQRTGREPVSTSREGIEVLLRAEPLPGLSIHGGPGVVIRSSEGLDRLSTRLGAEWRGGRIGGGPFRPFWAADAFLWQALGWTPVFAAEAGLAFGGDAGRHRVAATVGAGRSRAEQFFAERETVAGLLLTVAP